MNRIDLQDRRAVVTGGAQGIGRAIAERLLESGAAVSLWDRDAGLVAETTRALAPGGTVHYAVVDVTDLAAVEAAAAATGAAVGGIDILVANAGIAGPTAKLWEYPVDQWQRVIDIDLTGVFHFCRDVVPGMIERNYGRIVCTSSVAHRAIGRTAHPS